MQRNLRVFADITKVDPDLRMVYGYASTTSLDSQNERISKAALEKALPDYMRFANIREMHQNSAVGVAKEADFDGKGIYIGAKVVDDTAWVKVKEGVYKGFSIGGKSISKVNDEITDLRITEISLVDRPANPECIIDLFKAENNEQGNEESMEKKDQTIKKATPIKWTCGVEDSHIHATEDHAELCIKSHLEKIEAQALEKVAEREDVNPKEGENKYGDVKFADEENKKYPIDTEEHIKAAWNYINKEKNADKYSAEDLKTIKARIVSAWKSKIDKDGPPSASEKSELITDVKKGMYEVSSLANILQQLDCLQQCTEWEAKNEQDNSVVPSRLKQSVKELADILRSMVDEETAEMTNDKESEGQDAEQESVAMEMADKPKDIQKAGARHSKEDMARVQTLHDMAIQLGACCPTMGAEAEIDEKSDSYDGEGIEQKAAATGQGQKSENADLKKIDELNNTIKSAQKENATLKKKIEELSNTVLPAKGVTKAVAVAKEDDVGLNKSVKEEPKTVADIIKSKHQQGPDFLIGNLRKA